MKRPIGFSATPKAPELPTALVIQGQKLRMGCLGSNWLIVDRRDFEKVLSRLTNSVWTISEPPAPTKGNAQ